MLCHFVDKLASILLTHSDFTIHSLNSIFKSSCQEGNLIQYITMLFKILSQERVHS